MRLTADHLYKLYNISSSKIDPWLPHLNKAIEFAELNTLQRLAAFLAQIGVESGCLRYTREIWGKEPTKQQARYEGTDLGDALGNIHPGDGFRYRGRGLIQATGRYNYRRLYQLLSKCFTDVPNFEEEPEALEEHKWAALSAAMYWKDKNLNKYCDNGDFLTLTKRINGGTNGLEERQELFIRALGILQS